MEFPTLSWSNGWLWFILFWFIALIRILVWHLFAYSRVSVNAVTQFAYCTVIGTVIALALSGVIVWFFTLKNPVGILAIVFLGQWVARRISVLIQTYPDLKRQRRIMREIEEAGGWEAYRAKKGEGKEDSWLATTEDGEEWTKAK